MNFEIKGKDFFKDGKSIKIISGAVHYFRNMRETWDDIFKKMKAMGLNCVETYCAWNMHEKQPGVFDFTGNLDIAEFIRTAEKNDLMVIVRPGPYICAEWEFGGLPGGFRRMRKWKSAAPTRHTSSALTVTLTDFSMK
jgi:beta-galactosidase